MAKKATTDSGSAQRGNGFDPKSAKLWMGEYEKGLDELLSLKMEYMSDCKEVRQNMKDVLDRAKDAGIPKKTLRQATKVRELENKIKDITEGGEPDDVQTLEQFRHALGDLADLPLGQAAVSRAAAAGMPGADAPASMG